MSIVDHWLNDYSISLCDVSDFINLIGLDDFDEVVERSDLPLLVHVDLGDDFDSFPEKISTMIDWLRHNASHRWDICRHGFYIDHSSMKVVFNFADDVDLTAFKLQWG